jgi:membrane-anchored glycerophosphoryl diester phosphodiesterase (GDPDase)
MQGVLLWIGRLAGFLGTLLMIAAVLWRVSGRYFVGGFQIGTVLQAGIAMLILGCLVYLILLVEYRRN